MDALADQRTSPVICTNRMTRRYGKRTGVESVDLSIAEGEMFGFLGPNGSGKTTTIRLLMGFLKPTSGCAHVFGQDCWKSGRQLKANVGYLPGDVRLYPWLTVERGLRISSLVRGRDVAPHGNELADRLCLERQVPVRKMSRGMRQKLGLILSLAHRPRLLILDEPTGGLDPLIQNELIDYLREVTRQGHTVFFSSHTLSEVEQLCDRIAIVRDGRIVTDEHMETLRQRARRSVTITFADQETARKAVVPDWFTRLESTDRKWFGQMDGAAGQLVTWAAAHQAEDLEIGAPDLESLFRAFFRAEEGAD